MRGSTCENRRHFFAARLLLRSEPREDLLVYLDAESRLVRDLHLPVLYLEFPLRQLVNERVRLLLVFEEKPVRRGDCKVKGGGGVHGGAPVVGYPHEVVDVRQLDNPLHLGDASNLACIWLEQID